MTGEHFYANGLNFSCKRCSACCRYEAGFVFLSDNDLNKLSLQVKMDSVSFIKTYCRWVKDYNNKESLSLKEKYNRDCIFWNNGCTVYEARPLQCVIYPFWESILASKKAWDAAKTECPGMDSGEFHSEEEINRYIEMRDAEPIIKRKRKAK